jgi:catecholate siderophore receptor
MRDRVAIRLALLCLSFASAPVASGQPSSVAAPAAPALREIRGTVVDATGGAVADAVVTLQTPHGPRQTVSDALGQFVFDAVPDGAASLDVSFPGFAPVSLRVAAALDLRVVLHPVSVVEEVTVRAPSLTASRTRSLTKANVALRDVPQAVSVITRELIDEQAMGGMADVVRYMPGVGMAQGEGHRDAPIFRGNTSTSDFFVDGVRDDTQYLRDLYNVERVEALKGPNGMLFGRGGVGGVINRVTRQADWTPSREISVQGGSWGRRRVAGDAGHALSRRAAVRLTGMYENSDTFRASADLERYGVNPTAAFALGQQTILRAGYEHFHDRRTTDRGVPSFQGRPLATDATTFFGDPDVSNARITVNAITSLLEHRVGAQVTIRSRLHYADYGKFYRNVFAGAVNAAGSAVSLSGYDSATDRRNLFHQTDLLMTHRSGGIDHTLAVGTEIGRQVTDNRRRTGYFLSAGSSVTSVTVPIAQSSIAMPIEFRPAATDADNHGVATAAAVYVQDQLAVSPRLQALLGLRYDRFELDLRNRRSATDLSSVDGLLSPRLGLIYSPLRPVSLYASYSLSYLPRAGEQLASLSPSNQTLDPEEFRNYEVGAKLDLTPELSFTAAVYRLNRGNVEVADPQDTTRSLLVDGQRTQGVEAELAGIIAPRWRVAAGYAYQDGEITRSLAPTALAGARLAQVPAHSGSLWNRLEVSRAWAVGMGVIARSDVFVATDNRVVLPGFARVDAAVFFAPGRQIRAQVNIENLFDARYFPAAHNNNNITPGSPRAVRLALTTRF